MTLPEWEPYTENSVLIGQVTIGVNENIMLQEVIILFYVSVLSTT